MNRYAAVDLGASNGRVIVGNLDKIEVMHRFPSSSFEENGSLFWDIESIFSEIKTGLKKAFGKYPGEIKSIGVDTWGVDFVLLDDNGTIIGNPYHYRDNMTDGIMDEFFKLIPREEVYNLTGIQFMQFNTIFQLFALTKKDPEIIKRGKCFLSIPNYFNYLLSGEKKNEYSHATTTQLYNPVKHEWSTELITKIGLDPDIFQEVVPSGTILGKLLPDIAGELGADRDVFITTAGCHDTASAVAAVPAAPGTEYAYLSSGTWSLLGIELEKPLINKDTLNNNFTNEGSADGGIRFLKNIMGLWILQECKREWENSGMDADYADLVKSAEEFGKTSSYIDPNDSIFLKPGTPENRMIDRVNNGRQCPPAETVRIILESLARCYAENISILEKLTGKKIDVLHIIGGGAQNKLLNKLTSIETGIPVAAGPVEATAIGNILIQSIAFNEISSIEAGRKVIASNSLFKI